MEAIKTWPQPTTIKELQRFLGFSNFYRRFIQNYSTLTNPLMNLLLNKPKSLSWSIAAKEAFEKLMTSFTQVPILVHQDPERPFIVEVDASTTGVGAILSSSKGIHLYSIHAPSSPENSARRNVTMTSATGNSWLLSWPPRIGDTGLREPNTHSPFLRIIRTCNI